MFDGCGFYLWTDVASVLMFFATLGPCCFKDRFCIILGSCFNELLDRPVGENLIHSGHFATNQGCAGSELAPTCQWFPIGLASLFDIDFDIGFDIDFCIVFHRFGTHIGSHNPSGGHTFRPTSRRLGLRVSSGSRPGANLGATCDPKQSQTIFS